MEMTMGEEEGEDEGDFCREQVLTHIKEVINPFINLLSQILTKSLDPVSGYKQWEKWECTCFQNDFIIL